MGKITYLDERGAGRVTDWSSLCRLAGDFVDVTTLTGDAERGRNGEVDTPNDLYGGSFMFG